MKVEHLSASRISTYQQCQLKYHAIYDLGIRDGDPHPLTIMGKAVHRVGEMGVNTLLGNGTIQWMESVESTCKEMNVSPANTILAKELVNNALDWGYLRNLDRCVGTEIEFDLVLPNCVKVVGYIDRLDIKDNCADVIDLKTQKRAFNDDTLKDEWQSVTYNWASRQIRPEITGTSTLSYWVLRHRVQRCWITADDAKRGEDKLMAISEEIMSCEDPQPTPSGLCPWCPYQPQCSASKEGVKARFKRKKK